MVGLEAFFGELIVIPVHDCDRDIIDLCDTLQATLTPLPVKSCVMLMGDFNAEVEHSICATTGVREKFDYRCNIEKERSYRTYVA